MKEEGGREIANIMAVKCERQKKKIAEIKMDFFYLTPTLYQNVI